MTNNEIIKKAIDKALGNGYKFTDHSRWIYDNLLIIKDSSAVEFYVPIIFSHEFAQKFWGEDEEWKYEHKEDNFPYMRADYDRLKCCKAWEYHLQQMVLKEEPLKYLKRFL